MKIFKVFTFSSVLLSFGVCFSMQNLRIENIQGFSEDGEKRPLSSGGEPSRPLSETVKELKLYSYKKNMINSKNGSESEVILNGFYLDVLPMLCFCKLNKKIDRNIIHSILISNKYDDFNKNKPKGIKTSRLNTLNLVIAIMRYSFSDRDVKSLLNNKCEVKFSDGSSEEMSPLSISLILNDLEVVDSLVKEGADESALTENEKKELLELKSQKLAIKK